MAVPNVDLANVEWGNYVPAADGKIMGDPLHNLSSIAQSSLKDNPVIQKKCWNFVTIQDTGIKTYVGGKILAQNGFASKTETVTFWDGDKKVDLYKLAALKKDFPEFSISKLSKISSEGFDELIRFVYEGDDSNVDTSLTGLMQIGAERDLALMARSKNYNLNNHDVENCPVNHLPRLLNAVIDQHVAKRDLDYKAILLAFRDRINGLDPKDRESVKVGVKLFKILNNNDEPLFDIAKKTELYGTNPLQTASEAFLGKSTHESVERGFFSSLLRDAALFLSASFNQWFDVDNEFIIKTLREVPKLTLIFTDEISEEKLDALQKLPNLTDFILKGDHSEEFIDLLYSKNFKNMRLIP